MVARIAMCAALYAVVNGLTAPIGTPWGVGQFRPGVIIPALFTIMSGTLVGAVGAGLGSLVGDILFLVPLGQTNPTLALLAGLPGNFVGFLLFGLIVNRLKSWSAFAAGTVVSLLVGNMVAATGVMLLAIPFSDAASFWVGVLGFTFFWEFTMLPFMILLLPLLLRSLKNAPYLEARTGGIENWTRESPFKVLAVSSIFSLPFFAVGSLSYLGYFSQLYSSWPLLGGTLGPLMTLFELGIAVSVLLSPIAPMIAYEGKRIPENA